MRRAGSAALVVVAGLAFAVGVLAAWAHTTVYDSTTFSDRAVSVLDSVAVRQELSRRLTEELARSGNQQATSFGPAVQLVIEGVVDTDTFRSILRTAIRRTHAGILAGEGGKAGLNLSDSVALINSALQLPTSAPTSASRSASATPSATPSATTGNSPTNGLGNSLADVTQRLQDLGLFRLHNTVLTIALGSLATAVLASAGALILATDRRRGVRRLGWAFVLVGAGIEIALLVLQWWASTKVGDARLKRPVRDVIFHTTSDLRVVGLWIVAYGLIVVAAAGRPGVRYTPKAMRDRVSAWLERRRQSRAGTIAVGSLGLLIGAIVVSDPIGSVRLAVIAAGLWLSFLAVTELLRLLRSARPAAVPKPRWRRVGLVATPVAVVVALLSVGLVVTSGAAARRADAAGRLRCNGSASLCDLRLDQVMLAGTHESYSASLYPGFLFAHQTETITGQLNDGVRALLIDTHYGVSSSLRLPGSDTPVVLTDRATELRAPPGDQVTNPQLTDRAARLAARAPRAANARRDIYLCHLYCELGAVPFASGLAEIKTFLDTHPDQVVMTIIEDATTTADTVAAIQAAGLADRAATLRPGQPLPTLRELIDSNHTLLVFAERGGAGGPSWYHQAFQWFQETPFQYGKIADFNCLPNRGSKAAPLFLVNHWVTTTSPADTATAAEANSRKVVQARIERCISQRGVVPNVVAVNFSSQGDLVSTLAAVNRATLRQLHRTRTPPPPGPASPGPETANQPPPNATDPPPPPAMGTMPSIPSATPIPTLTGGDPDRFCPTIPTMLRTVVAWGETILSEAPADAGVTDLVYGPALTTAISAYAEAAPDQLAARVTPLLARAREATDALRNIGLDDAAIQGLRNAAQTALQSAQEPDGVAIQASLTSLVTRHVALDRLRAAAVVFESTQADPATLLDLGTVSDSVARAAGFNCPDAVATL